MSRKQRYDLFRDNQALSRTENGHLKRAERARRLLRMKELLKKGSFPYTPTLRSWVSVELDKPWVQITEADVKTLVG